MLRPNLPAIDDKEGITVPTGLPRVVDAHVHIFPRYMTEPDLYRQGPIWNYSSTERASIPFDPGKDAQLQQVLRSTIQSLQET